MLRGTKGAGHGNEFMLYVDVARTTFTTTFPLYGTSALRWRMIRYICLHYIITLSLLQATLTGHHPLRDASRPSCTILLTMFYILLTGSTAVYMLCGRFKDYKQRLNYRLLSLSNIVMHTYLTILRRYSKSSTNKAYLQARLDWRHSTRKKRMRVILGSGGRVDNANLLDEMQSFIRDPFLAMPRVATDIWFTGNLLQVLTVHHRLRVTRTYVTENIYIYICM